MKAGRGTGSASRHAHGAALLAALTITGCQDPQAVRRVETVRETTVAAGDWRLGADPMERFGLRSIAK